MTTRTPASAQPKHSPPRTTRRVRSATGIALALLAVSASVPALTAAAAAPDSTAAQSAADDSAPKVGIAMGDQLLSMADDELALALDDAVALDAGWIRTDLPWESIRPQDDADDHWERFDRVLDAAESRGLEVLPVLTRTAEWMETPGCVDHACPASAPARFAQFAAKAAARYGDRIRTWEVWNEPNRSDSWMRPDPEAYARLLSATTTAIKTADADATVLMGGLAYENETTDAHIDTTDYLDAVCDAGACAEIDGVAFHPFSFPESPLEEEGGTTPWDTISGADDSVAAVLDTHGRADAKIWLTEYGAPTGHLETAASAAGRGSDTAIDHAAEARQAQMATDSLRAVAQDPRIAGMWWYTVTDHPERADTPEAHFGLRRADSSAKPAWAAFAAGARALRDSTSQTDPPGPIDVEADTGAAGNRGGAGTPPSTDPDAAAASDPQAAPAPRSTSEAGSAAPAPPATGDSSSAQAGDSWGTQPTSADPAVPSSTVGEATDVTVADSDRSTTHPWSASDDPLRAEGGAGSGPVAGEDTERSLVPLAAREVVAPLVITLGAVLVAVLAALLVVWMATRNRRSET